MIISVSDFNSGQDSPLLLASIRFFFKYQDGDRRVIERHHSYNQKNGYICDDVGLIARIPNSGPRIRKCTVGDKLPSAFSDVLHQLFLCYIHGDGFVVYLIFREGSSKCDGDVYSKN